MNRLPEGPEGRLSPALFLDFDGTLAPIARRPDEVRPDPRLPATLARLQRVLDGALAVVSGRPLTEIDVYLSPLHAARRRRARRRAARPRRPDARARGHAAGRRPCSALSDLASEHAGLRVELKPASLALHYREAPAFEDLCLDAAREAVARRPGWVVQRGKCVVELRPRDVTKGRTIAWFMGNAPFAGRLPVFVGDDDADEDGFAVVQAAGGWGVKVGPGATRGAPAARCARRSAALARAAGRSARSWRPKPSAAAGKPPRLRRCRPPRGRIGSSMAQRLVVVSNRVADPRKTAAGGLAVALGDALSERGGLWFGWSGKVIEPGEGSADDSAGAVDAKRAR